MARTQRIEYEGAVYHVTARGNERREIFRDDADREHFLRVLGDWLLTMVPCFARGGIRGLARSPPGCSAIMAT
jgi:hypothetical protein